VEIVLQAVVNDRQRRRSVADFIRWICTERTRLGLILFRSEDGDRISKINASGKKLTKALCLALDELLIAIHAVIAHIGANIRGDAKEVLEALNRAG